MSVTWDDLTESQKSEIEAGYYRIVEWYKKQWEEREAELKALGKWQYFGLDSNQSAMSDLIAERNHRIERLRLRYDLVGLDSSKAHKQIGED